MRIAVLGASGGVGTWFLRLARDAGHEVRGLVRPGASVRPPDGVTLVRGEALDPTDLQRAVDGAEAVVSCLGQRRAGRSPWSDALSPPDLLGRVAGSLLPCMEQAGIGRFVFVSAGGVGESREQLSASVRWLVRTGRIGDAYRDLEVMESRVARSGLDWTAVRPVTLIDGAPTGRARTVDRYTMFSTVRRSDVAAFMLAALDGSQGTSRRAVLIGS